MTSEDIQYQLSNHPTLQILRLYNARWILPFLYTVFKENGRMTVSERLLIQLLAETLAQHSEGVEHTDESGIAFGESEESRSRKYVQDWVKRRILQDLSDSEGEVQYQLSAHSERLFQWLSTLQRQQQHVGTASRFRLVFNALRDIVEHTEDSARRRLDILKDKKAEIEKEIFAIENGIAPTGYSREQVQEQVALFSKMCYELISDFREVEDNFRQIHRGIVARHTKEESNKGAIIGYTFEAYDALRQSPQGKSFYAFWDFLISRAGQEEWDTNIEHLLVQLQDRGITEGIPFVQDIKSLLLRQGRIVYNANDKMAEKISRIISEKEMESHRRLKRQLNGIKELVFDLMDSPEDLDAGIAIYDCAEITLIMERRLQLSPKKAAATITQPKVATQAVTDPTRLNKLVKQSGVDRKKLWRKVELTLQKQKVATLKEVLQMHPAEHGLAEIIGYFHFLRDKPTKSSVVASITELIPLNDDETKFVEVPCLMFNL